MCAHLSEIVTIAQACMAPQVTGKPATSEFTEAWPARKETVRRLAGDARQIVSNRADRWINPRLGTVPGAWTTALLAAIRTVDENLYMTAPANHHRYGKENLAPLWNAAGELIRRRKQLEDVDLSTVAPVVGNAELTIREKAILAILAKLKPTERLLGKEIKARLPKDLNNVSEATLRRRDFFQLKKRGLIENVRPHGYRLATPRPK